MKTIMTALFSAIIINTYSQKWDLNSIVKHSYSEIYTELFNNNYTEEESKFLGDSLAKLDRLKGIKNILRQDGPFDSGCFDCIYGKYGYKSTIIGSNDIISENTEAFKDAYNKVMISYLSAEQQKEINQYIQKSDGVFREYIHTIPEIEFSTKNDTTKNIKIKSKALEDLFHSDVNHLIVGMMTEKYDSVQMEFSYYEVKYKGIDIKCNKVSEKKILFYFDFRNIPDNYNICWSKNLKQKYKFAVSINNK